MNDNSMIIYGNVYSETCEFGEVITIGGRVECKKMSGKTVKIMPFTNLPVEKDLENRIFELEEELKK